MARELLPPDTMKKPTHPPKLSLSTESLRNLSANELRHAAAGCFSASQTPDPPGQPALISNYTDMDPSP